ncbi:MAG: hypothetical protein ABI183_15915 [Polyangiaceae bacterium]
MEGYRDAPPAPANSVVLFYPNGSSSRFGLAAYAVALAGLAFYLLVPAVTQIRVRCTRVGDTCSILSTRPIVGTRTKTMPLSIITAAEARLVSGKGRKYGVVLRTTSGDETLGERLSEADAQQKADALNAFIEMETPSVDIETNSTNPLWAAVTSVVCLVCLVAAWLAVQYERIEVVWSDRIFRVIRTRWPLRPRIRDFPLESVRRAFLVKKSSRNGPAMSLEVDGERDIDLGGPTPGKPIQLTVDEINDLLRIRDTGGPGAG